MYIETPKSKSHSHKCKSVIVDRIITKMSSWNVCDTIDATYYGIVTYLYLNSDSTAFKPHRYSDSSFDGVCVDTGAQVSVYGHRQALAY